MFTVLSGNKEKEGNAQFVKTIPTLLHPSPIYLSFPGGKQKKTPQEMEQSLYKKKKASNWGTS